MYKNYIFDLYGTLVDLKTDEEKEELWKNFAIFYTYMGAHYEAMELKENYLRIAAEELDKVTKTLYPDVKIEKVFKRLFKDKGIIAEKRLQLYTTRLFRGLSTEHLSLYDGVVEMLEELKGRGKSLFILSNGQRQFSMPELKILGIRDYFEEMFFSGDVEMAKPEFFLFNCLCDPLRLKKPETIMIGNDHTTDIAGANKYKLDSLYVHTNHSRSGVIEKLVDDEGNITYKEIVEIKAKYKIYDGDVRKIIPMICMESGKKTY